MTEKLEIFNYQKMIESLKEAFVDEDYEGYLYNLIALCTNLSAEKLEGYGVLPKGEHPIHCELLDKDPNGIDVPFDTWSFIDLTLMIDELEYESFHAEVKQPFKIAFLANEVLSWALEVSGDLIRKTEYDAMENFHKSKRRSTASKGGKASNAANNRARDLARKTARNLKDKNPNITLPKITDHILAEMESTPKKYGVCAEYSTIKQNWLRNL
jgi:hypothetical protein